MESFISTFKRMMENSEIALSEEYISSARITSIIFGVIAMGLVIAAAVLSKKNMALGITAGVMQLVGMVASQQSVISYSSLDFFYTAIGNSQADANQKIQEYYAGQLTHLIPYGIGMALAFAWWIITLLYIVKLFKFRPKILPVAALVIQIARYLFVSHINYFVAVMRPVTEADLKSNDMVFLTVSLIPAILIGVIGVLQFIKAKKNPVAAVAPIESAE